MTREDIIRMAREAGFVLHAYPQENWLKLMERFAALAAEQPKQEPVVWWDVNKPLDYLTRCENGTTFHNQVIMPRHAVAWAYTNSPEDEALRRDAERYRWLQDAGQKYWMEFADMTAEATEAAIDAAMGDKT